MTTASWDSSLPRKRHHHSIVNNPIKGVVLLGTLAVLGFLASLLGFWKNYSCVATSRYSARMEFPEWNNQFHALLFPNQNDNKKLFHEKQKQHTIPTVLSIVDSTLGDYISALENPLYETLKKATFVHFKNYGQGVDDKTALAQVILPHLRLDRQQMWMRESLLLSWTLGRDEQGNPIVQDHDILVLYCHNDNNNGGHRFLDAATIAQARASSRKHQNTEHANNNNNSNNNNNTWYFPSFPVLRHEFCQFSLYKTSSIYDNIDTTSSSPSKPSPTYSLLANSNVLHIVDANTAPTAIHLALGDRIDEMVVQFKTGNINNNYGIPVVQYGIHADSLDQIQQGTTHSYTANDMCQEPATIQEPGKFLPPGNLHIVRLQNLLPNTTYHYRVGVQQQEAQHQTEPTIRSNIVWSRNFSFTSQPVTNPDSEPFSYLVYGDQGCPALGWGNGGVWTAAMAAREVNGNNGTHTNLPIRAVHHFGDLSYALGAAHIWDEWFQMISSFSPWVPLMIAVGNHEYDHTAGGGIGKDPSGVTTPDGYRPYWGNYRNDSGGECGVPTDSHFTMPNSKGSNRIFWYSFDYANVHTTVVSSEHDLSPGSIQYQWLERDLKAVNRSLTPWLVLELHRPLYESEVAIWDYRVGVALRLELEDLLKQYQVDAVLAGHYHSYLRSCSGLYKNKCSNGGPLHITIGSAGAHLDENELFSNAWTEKYIKGTYGYGRVTVANSSALHFEFVQAGSLQDPEAGKVLDEVWLVKKKDRLHKAGFALPSSVNT